MSFFHVLVCPPSTIPFRNKLISCCRTFVTLHATYQLLTHAKQIQAFLFYILAYNAGKLFCVSGSLSKLVMGQESVL